MAIAVGEDEVQRKFPVVCLIGLTGSGISSTANSLCGEVKFCVARGTTSVTNAIDVLLTRWFNEPNENPVIVIDNPGIGCSKNLDTRLIAEMIVGLKNARSVHAFLLVLNYFDHRISSELQEPLNVFGQMFGPEFFQNVLLVFTRFSHDESSKWRRMNGKYMSEH